MLYKYEPFIDRTLMRSISIGGRKLSPYSPSACGRVSRSLSTPHAASCRGHFQACSLACPLSPSCLTDGTCRLNFCTGAKSWEKQPVILTSRQRAPPRARETCETAVGVSALRCRRKGEPSSGRSRHRPIPQELER